jgi:hypothetical protein
MQTGLLTILSAKLETRAGPNRVDVRMTFPDPAQRARVEFPEFYLVDSAGKETHLDFPSPAVTIGEREFPLPGNARLLNPSSGDERTRMTVELTPEQAARLAAGKVALHLAAHIRLQRMAPLAHLSTEAGARATAFHSRFELDSSWLVRGFPSASVRVATAGSDFGSGFAFVSGDLFIESSQLDDEDEPPPDFSSVMGEGVMAYFFVNDQHHEALRLAVAGYSGGSSPLPLTGSSGSTSTTRLETRLIRPESTQAVTPDWVRAAELRAFAWTTIRTGHTDILLKVVPVSAKDPISPFEVRPRGISSSAIRSGLR